MSLVPFSEAGHETGVCQTTNWDGHAFTVEGSREATLVSEAHVALSTVSAVCCLSALGLSMRFPSLRKFPANMLLWKTACDLVTSLIIVGTNVALLSMEGNQFTNGAMICSNGLLAGAVCTQRTRCTVRVPPRQKELRHQSLVLFTNPRNDMRCGLSRPAPGRLLPTRVSRMVRRTRVQPEPLAA